MPSVPILELRLEVSVREDDKIYSLLTLKAHFMQTKVFREEEGGDVIKHLQRGQRRKEQNCSLCLNETAPRPSFLRIPVHSCLLMQELN